MKIKKQIVNKTDRVYSGTNSKKYLTIHMTDNWRDGADAQAHANIQSNGNPREASWHWQVDDTLAIQSFEHSKQCWHAGDRKGNEQSIAIEGCVNGDGEYVSMIENMAELTKTIMEEESIPLKNVVQHNAWSGKDCPSDLRAGKHGITWEDFLNLVTGSKSNEEEVKESSIDKLVRETKAGLHGNGAQRKKSLGSQYQAVQDVINGKKQVNKPKKSLSQLVKETKAGKHGNGSQRKKSLGSQYQAVQDVINGKKTPSKKSVKQLADEVNKGLHGKGEQRKKSLGTQYKAVQQEINRRYGG